jgi:hypothetical protein
MLIYNINGIDSIVTVKKEDNEVSYRLKSVGLKKHGNVVFNVINKKIKGLFDEYKTRHSQSFKFDLGDDFHLLGQYEKVERLLILASLQND